MNTKTTNIIFIIIAITSLSVVAFFYPELPEEMASHWNGAGEVNGYMGKFWGVALLPLIMLGLFAIYHVIPKIDPLKKNIESFRKYYNIFWIFMILFLAYVYFLTIIWNLGQTFNFGVALMPAISILIFMIGVFLGKTKRNYFIGIRTPWTLASDKVWDKTHKFGSKLFKLAGALSILSLLISAEFAIKVLVVSVITAAVVSLLYSYLEYRKL